MGETQKSSPRTFAIKLSQYFLYLLFFVIWLLTTVINLGFHSDEIPIKEDAQPWNSNTNPIYIPHISDTHISPKNDEAVKNLKHVFFDTLYLLHPSYMIHTGDIIDQYERFAPSISEPNSEHWKKYNSILSEYSIPDDFILYNIGNHDQWGLISSTSSKNYVFTNLKMDPNNYYAIKHEIGDGVRVISWSPYRFPSAYGPALFVNDVKSEYLDALEKVLKEPTEAKYTIVADHTPSYFLHPMGKTSDSKLDLKELLKKYNVDVFLDGHTHPNQADIMHFGATPEIAVPDQKNNDGYGLLTIDNGRIGYHYYETTAEFTKNGKNKTVVITHPVPHKIQKHIYKDHSFQIRALCFTNGSGSCDIKAEGYGTLVKQRDINIGVSLYALNVEVDKGIHKLKITGDITEEIEFAVDCKTGPYHEHVTVMFNYYGFTFGLILFTIFDILVIIFAWIPHDKIKIFQEVEMWLEGDLDNDVRSFQSNAVYWILSIVIGPFLVGKRITDHPLWIRIVLIVLFLWSFVLPISFIKIEDKVGIIWAYGYIINGKAIFDIFSFFFTTTYHCIFYLWEAWLSVFRFPLGLCLIPDIIITIIILFLSYFVWVYFGTDYIIKGYAAASFEYVFFPIFMLAVIIYLIVDKTILKSKISPKENPHDQVELHSAEGTSDDN